jgi:N-methylhydantoinase B/oxoprolinase/acetone carboxylase alpha subunit
VLCKGVFEELKSQGVPDDAISWRPMLQLRYDGTDTTIPVAFSDFDFAAARTEFETAHKAQFGFVYENKTIIIEAISVEGIDDREDHRIEPERALDPAEISDGETRPVYANGKWHDARIVRRDRLSPGNRLKGPALIIEPNQTIVIEPGWEATINTRDHVVLTRFEKLERALAIGADKADPIMLEVFNNLFMSIAEQMGVTLQNTAYSVNIKERLDFSCAVFDRTGALVANAPHMPVHLGSMDRSVETIIRLNEGDIHPGDVFALNAPYNGGTHLPDITVVTPVFSDDGSEILFWAASRGHHADVGGSAPGSMTPLATTVDEEGVLIDNFRIVERGRFREKELMELLTDHPYPVRNVTQNVADLKAQIAANEKGVADLRKMVTDFGLDVVEAYMGHVQDNAIFGALGALANSQGTMNNLTFGNDKYQYYETICSGSPAGFENSGRGFNGTSGVHTHMTNSRLTDPEILEMRFPVELEDFHIREDSGGKGRFSAGNGTKRTIRFLERMDLAILSSHRNRPPLGIDGGGEGEVGKTEVRRRDGTVETLKACDQTVLEAGEAVILTTPTAGGAGKR